MHIEIGPLGEIIRDQTFERILAHGQSLARGCEGGECILQLGLRLGEFQRRQVADFHAAFGFPNQLLAQFQGLLLHPHVLTRGDEIRVAQLDGQHRLHDLETKRLLRDLEIFAPDGDLLARGIDPKIFQQMLLHRELDAAVRVVGRPDAAGKKQGILGRGREVGGDALVHERGAQVVVKADGQHAAQAGGDGIIPGDVRQIRPALFRIEVAGLVEVIMLPANGKERAVNPVGTAQVITGDLRGQVLDAQVKVSTERQVDALAQRKEADVLRRRGGLRRDSKRGGEHHGQQDSNTHWANSMRTVATVK